MTITQNLKNADLPSLTDFVPSTLKINTNAACSGTAGQAVIACTGYTFSSADVGSLVILQGAGAAVSPRVVIPYQDMLTMISSVNTGNNTASLAANITTAVTNTTMTWGPDQQTYIQNAFTACPGGFLSVPGKPWLHSSYLTMATNCNLLMQPGSVLQGYTPLQDGIGMNTNTSIFGPGTLRGVVTARTTGVPGCGIYVGQSNSTGFNNVYVGGGLTIQRYTQSAVVIEGSTNVTVDGIFIDHTLANAFYISSQSADINVFNTVSNYPGDNCWEATSSTADTVQVTRVTVRNNTCNYSFAGGGLSDGSTHVKFLNNTIYRPQLFGYESGVDNAVNPTFAASDIVIQGGEIDGADYSQLNGTSAVVINSTQRITVSGVNIRNGPGIFQAPGTVSTALVGSIDVTIANNTFNAILGNGIDLEGDVAGLQVNGNTINGVAVGTSTRTSSNASGLWFNSATAAITAATVTNNSVANCVVPGTTYSPITVVGMTFNGLGTNSVTNCSGGNGAAIFQSSATNTGVLLQQIVGTPNVASTPPLLINGAFYTGGTATTNKPMLLIEPSGTLSTGWSSAGTGLGVNAASGFAGRPLDIQIAGTSQFYVQNSGAYTSTFNSTAAQAAMTISGTGSCLITEPFRGTSKKEVIIYCTALNGTATYTFPTSFTNQPVVSNTSGLASSLVTGLSTTAVTVTASTVTGFLFLEGF